jgi:hypothetical protein
MPPFELARRGRWLLAEITVVVLGVLIALWVNAWYGGVLDARDEQIYLGQLIEDLAETERQMEEAASNTIQAEESAAALIRAIRGDEEPSPDSVNMLLRRIRIFNNPVPILGTAEALVSTGDLRLLPDPVARTAITRWMSRSRDYWLSPLSQLEDRHEQLLLELLTIADRWGVEPPGRGGVPIDGEDRRQGRPPFMPDVSSFLRDPRIYSVVANLAETKQTMARFRRVMSEDAGRLRQELEPLLEVPPSND